MSPISRYAVLLDGGFVVKKLQSALKRFPIADDVETLCNLVHEHDAIRGLSLLRAYFYHAPPANDSITNPLDKSTLDLASTPVFADNERLLDSLELRPNFALRLGETVVHDWRLGSRAMDSIMASPRPIGPQDLVPNISQKGVDLRIGLDIARLALRQLVGVIVVVTGDSDLIPAFKFARREGIRMYLATLNHGVRRELKAHCDLTLNIPLPAPGLGRS